jgi:hypothetical protein
MSDGNLRNDVESEILWEPRVDDQAIAVSTALTLNPLVPSSVDATVRHGVVLDGPSGHAHR